jgi:hypothetical protein
MRLRMAALGAGEWRSARGGTVELTALPDGAGQDGAAGGLQSSMVVTDDEADAAHDTVDQAVEEGSPVDFGFRGIAGDVEHAPSPVRPDAEAENTAASRTTPPSRSFS